MPLPPGYSTGNKWADTLMSKEGSWLTRRIVDPAGAQMDFQREMSNTEVQRRMADLTAAGMNPMLAATGGASSPQGSSAGAGGLGSLATSAMSVAQTKKTLKLLDAQVAEAQANASEANARQQMTWQDAFEKNERYSFYFDDMGRPKGPLMDLLSSQHLAAMANSSRSLSESESARLAIPEQKAIATMFERLGSSPAMLKVAMPFILQLMRGPGR